MSHILEISNFAIIWAYPVVKLSSQSCFPYPFVTSLIANIFKSIVLNWESLKVL